MASLIFTSDKFYVFKVIDPDDRTILPLTYSSLRDPFAVRKYLNIGKIFLVINREKSLVTNTFEFFKEENKNQVIAFLIKAKHYRNRINEPFDLKTFFKQNPELALIEEIAQEIKECPLTENYLNF